MEFGALIEFYKELACNNNKVWFDANKARYKALRADFDNFAERTIAKMSELDTDLKGLTVANCTYRIYRDIRFSPDKTPYKTFIGLWMPKGGKKGPYAGYYLHIEPKENLYFICAGTHLLAAPLLQSIREDIMCNPTNFTANIKAAQGFELDWESALKKQPSNWPCSGEYAAYFRLKDFLLMKRIDTTYLCASDFEKHLVTDFARCVPFVQGLNRAIDYALEQEE